MGERKVFRCWPVSLSLCLSVSQSHLVTRMSLVYRRWLCWCRTSTARTVTRAGQLVAALTFQKATLVRCAFARWVLPHSLSPTAQHVCVCVRSTFHGDETHHADRDQDLTPFLLKVGSKLALRTYELKVKEALRFRAKATSLRCLRLWHARLVAWRRVVPKWSRLVAVYVRRCNASARAAKVKHFRPTPPTPPVCVRALSLELCRKHALCFVRRWRGGYCRRATRAWPTSALPLAPG
jgi:hypothetical protein